MNKNHYCTREQHEKLWSLGFRVGSPAINQLSCGELLDLLPFEITDINLFLVIEKCRNGYKCYYDEWSSQNKPISEYWQKPDKSLAQLAADRLIWLLEEEIIKPEDLCCKNY